MKPRLVLVFALCLAPLPARAEVFTNHAKGYDLETPAGWRLAHPDFMLMGPGGASLAESDLPEHGPRTLEKISKTAGMIACIGADYTETNERFALKGANWEGEVTVFVEPVRANRLQRHVLQLVTQQGSEFHLFYLALPSREWLSDRPAATALLSKLRYHP